MLIYRRVIALFGALAIMGAFAGCSGASSTGAGSQSASPIGVALAISTVAATPDGVPASLGVEINRYVTDTNSVTLTATGVPAGVTVSYVQPLFGNSGTVNFAGSPTAVSGLYTVTITATDGTASATATISLAVAAADAITMTPANTTVTAEQNATPASDSLSFTRSYGNIKAITVTASGLPTGLTAIIIQPGIGNSGAVSFATSSTPAVPGTYTVTLTASDGTATSVASVAVTVGIVLTVANTNDTTIGISGKLQQFMSTGFEPDTTNNPFFINFPSTTDLAALNPLHLRLQPIQGTLPWLTNSSTPQASDWSFTLLDQTAQPVLATGDNSPMLQIAAAPGFLNDSSGHFIFNTANLQLLTTYAQNLVRYYNTGGFTWGGKTFQSSSSHHITWWAIFNEPNLNNLTAAQYVQLYNTLVPAMLSVDPTLKFVALELSDYSGQPALYVPTLVLPAASGGLAAQVNAIATHFYSTCYQTTTDASLFSSLTQFAADITYFRTQLATRSDLANVPVWVTENNVNSDYGMSNGYSSCTPTKLFVLDVRGTSGFFTAWRPLTFSRFAKAGNHALYHFLYSGNAQYGEVATSTAAKTLSYWTDFWLQRTFPWDGVSSGASLLKTTTTEATPSVDILAARNADNSVSLMVTNYAVASSTDNNGTGAARTVFVDVSALGTFTSATQVTLNASTSVANGPLSTALAPTTVLPVSFSGYGSVLYVLKP